MVRVNPSLLPTSTHQMHSRQKRLQSRIQSKTVNDCQHGAVVRTSDLFQHEHMGNEEHTIQDLHEIQEEESEGVRLSWFRSSAVTAGV